MNWSEAFSKKEILLGTIKKNYSAGMALGLLAQDSEIEARMIKIDEAAKNNVITPFAYFKSYQRIVNDYLDRNTFTLEKLEEILGKKVNQT